MSLKVLELFSGIGACSKALTNLGIDHEIVDAVEIDKYAVKSFNAVHGTNFEPQDITKWDKDIDVDLIMHGSPCFRKGELVNTIYGLTPIEQIKIGDTVKTADGQWRVVADTFVSRSDTLMDIKPSCAHLINTTENHPFYVLRGGKLSWIEAKDLTTKDYLCVPINTKKNEPEWEGVDLCYNGHKERSVKLPVFDSKFWYLVGRFIGDGWVTRRKDRADNISGIKICCAKNELIELEQKLGGVLPYCVVEDSTTYKLQFCNKELGVFCENFGIGAINKRIPQQVLDLDNKYLLPLYEGIMDSDGCCVKHRYKLETISKQLAYNMGELVLKLFNVPYQINKTIRPEKYEICGRVVNQHNTYSTFWRDSGYNENINFVKDGYLFSRIRKIESVDGVDTVYNLEVEGEHTYCVNNVAVHNCQDFSVAGRQAGGDEGSGTRSSLMYETLRIVKKLQPKYVIWENVKNLLSKKHRHNFDAYLEAMESLGYKNYYKVLNAADYGIPQHRERVFTISIREEREREYTWPEPFALEKRLGDMLESNVDEKYYISTAMMNYFMGVNQKPSKFPRKERFLSNINRKNQDVANSITTAPGQRPTDNFVKVRSANKRGYDLATVGDSVNLQFPTSTTRRGRVGHGVSQTLQTSDSMAVVIDDTYKNREARISSVCPTIRAGRQGLKVTEPNLKTQLCNSLIENGIVKGGEVINHSYTTSEQRDTLEKYIETTNGVTPTLTTRPDILGYVESAPVRIRKLTPKECWRLMGFDDASFDRASKVNSNAQLYKQAGNSICVNVLEKILRNLINE